MTTDHKPKRRLIDIFAGDDLQVIKQRLQDNLTRYDVEVSNNSIKLINKVTGRKITMVVKVKS